MFSQLHSAKKQETTLLKSLYHGSAALPQQAYIQNQNDYEEDEDDQNNGTILLEEDFQPDYEPSQEEIEEYAEYLGMNLTRDSQYFYIAREGLKTQLPQPWLPMRNSQGEIFYVNSLTQEKTFVHPCDSFYKAMFEKEKQKAAEKEITKRIELNKKKSTSIIEETKKLKNNDQNFFNTAKSANSKSIISKETGNNQKNKSTSNNMTVTQKSSGKKSKNESNLIEVIEQPSEGSDQDISQEEYEKGLMEEELRTFEERFIRELGEKLKELKGKEQEFEKKLQESVSLKKKQFTEKKNNWKSTVRKAVEREFQKQQKDEEKELNQSGVSNNHDNEQIQKADFQREQESWMNEELKKTQSLFENDLKTRQDRLKGLQLKVQKQQKEFEQSKENVRVKEDSVRQEVGKILGERRDQVEKIEAEKFKQESQDYMALLQQELARITKLAHYDSQDIAKEEAVQKLQLRDLYQRKCDWHKSKGLAEVQDEVRRFYEEERKNLEENLEKAEKQYLQAALPIRIEEMQRKQKEELEGMENKHKLGIQDITGKYQSKIKADELEGVVRRNEMKREQQIQGKSLLFNNKDFACLLPKTNPDDGQESNTNRSNIECSMSSKVLLQQLRESMKLQMEQRSLLRHEKRQLDFDISLFRNQLEIFKLEQPIERIKFLQDTAGNQNGTIHEYAEMLRLAQYDKNQEHYHGGHQSSSIVKIPKDSNFKSHQKQPKKDLFLKNSRTSSNNEMNGYGIINGNDLAKSGASTFWSTHKDNIPHFAFEDTEKQQEQEYQQSQMKLFYSQGGSNDQRNKRSKRSPGIDLMDQFISFHPKQQLPTNSNHKVDNLENEQVDNNSIGNEGRLNNFVNGQDQSANEAEELHSNRVVFPDDDSEEDRLESIADSNNDDLVWENGRKYKEEDKNQQDQGIRQEDIDNYYQDRKDQYLKGEEPLLRQDLSNGDGSNNQDIPVDPLEEFLSYEFTELQSLKRKLLQDKILSKKMHEYLSQQKLKIQELQLSGNDAQRFKRVFSEMAQMLNQNIAMTRQNQQNLINRENALSQIEEIIKNQGDQEQLQAAIDQYSMAAAVSYVEINEIRNTLNNELDYYEQKMQRFNGFSSSTAVKDQQKRRSQSQSVSSQKNNNYLIKNGYNNYNNSNEYSNINMHEFDRQNNGMSTPAQNHRNNKALHNNFMNQNNYESHNSNQRNNQMNQNQQQYYSNNNSSNWKGKENIIYSNQRQQQNQSSFLESRLLYEQSKREQLSQLHEAQNSAMQYKELQLSYAGQTAVKLNELIEAKDDPKEQLSLIFADHSQFLKHVKEQLNTAAFGIQTPMKQFRDNSSLARKMQAAKDLTKQIQNIHVLKC